MGPNADYGPQLSSSPLKTPPLVSVYPNLPQTLHVHPKGRRRTMERWRWSRAGRRLKGMAGEMLSSCVYTYISIYDGHVMTMPLYPVPTTRDQEDNVKCCR